MTRSGVSARSTAQAVLLLEEHNAFREALANVLSRDPDIGTVAQASTVEEGRTIVLRDPAHVDVVVTELSWTDEDAVRFLRELRESDTEVTVLVLTKLGDRDSHDLALESGAAEALTKDMSAEELVASIKKLGAN